MTRGLLTLALLTGTALGGRAPALAGQAPGAAYGPSGEGFFRISLTTPEDRLREAVDRLRRL